MSQAMNASICETSVAFHVYDHFFGVIQILAEICIHLRNSPELTKHTPLASSHAHLLQPLQRRRGSLVAIPITQNQILA